jgi:acetyltransferase
MEKFFQPKSIAVVGASRDQGTVGNEVLRNIIDSGYKGPVYPVNPKADEIHGVKAYHSILELPAPPDVAVFCIPAKFIISSLEQCSQKGINSVIIISAGFKEAGPEGAKLEMEMVERLKTLNVRTIGPNCVGMLIPPLKLNATFLKGMPKPGPIAFFSQSGALCGAVLDWAVTEGIGFSRFFSLGNNADLNEVDLMYALRDDPETKVILGYIEGVRDGRKFLQAAREVSKDKPVVVVKSGGTQSGARAASSHTGSLAGSAKAFGAVITQGGLIRAHTVPEMFDFAIAFAHQPIPKGPGLTILTNSGGPGVMGADAVEPTTLRLANLDKPTIDRLREVLPRNASLYNPVDIIGDSDENRYKAALDIILEDPNTDSVMVLMTPTAMSRAEKIADMLVAKPDFNGKTVVSVFMGGESVKEGKMKVTAVGIPYYVNPERAVLALDAMNRYSQWTKAPEPEMRSFPANKDHVREVFQNAREQGVTELGEIEARDVIESYGFHLPRNIVASTAKSVLRNASDIGYPLVMKIVSPDILHKSDFGGVRIGIKTGEDALTAYHDMRARARRLLPDADIRGVALQEFVAGGKEVILGMTRDPQFGPMLMFGLGGIYVEVLKDVSFRIAPLSVQDANAMVREIRSYPLLTGVRGEKPADVDAIVESLLRLSQLVTDFPEITELDINPLKVFAKGEGCIALDARLALEGESK